jgi:hypothetical protein
LREITSANLIPEGGKCTPAWTTVKKQAVARTSKWGNRRYIVGASKRFADLVAVFASIYYLISSASSPP